VTVPWRSLFGSNIWVYLSYRVTLANSKLAKKRKNSVETNINERLTQMPRSGGDTVSVASTKCVADTRP
jgi:hypothetical protein